jgi:hypothetical protein
MGNQLGAVPKKPRTDTAKLSGQKYVLALSKGKKNDERAQRDDKHAFRGDEYDYHEIESIGHNCRGTVIHDFSWKPPLPIILKTSRCHAGAEVGIHIARKQRLYVSNGC